MIKISNIQDFRFHDLRHSFASEMAAQGASPIQLGFLMGHKSFSMTVRYTHMEEDGMRESVEEMTSRIL